MRDGPERRQTNNTLSNFMTPPKEYFEQVPEGAAGAQRVGPYWYAFISPDSLFEMMHDGVFEESNDDEESLDRMKDRRMKDRIDSLEDELLDLESENAEFEEKIEKLEAELAELKAKLAVAK